MSTARKHPSVLLIAYALAFALSLFAPRAAAQFAVGADLNVTLSSSDNSIYLDFDNSNGQGFLHYDFVPGDDFEVGFFSDEQPYFRSHLATTLVDRDSIIDYFFFAGNVANPLRHLEHTVSGSRPMGGGNQNVYLENGSFVGDPYWGNGGASSGYLGFSFLNGTTNQTNYGFVELDYNDAANSLTLVRFAYDNTGAGILAGAELSAIPEPSTTAALMALAAGAVVLLARRRQAA